MAKAQPSGRLAKSAAIFDALGDPTRLSLVHRLAKRGPESISALAQDTEVSRQAVTKHLNQLEDAGLVQSERHGRQRIWRLRPRRFVEAREYLARIDKQWDGALARLKDFVERND